MTAKFDAASFGLEHDDGGTIDLNHSCGQYIGLEWPYTLASALATANIHKCPDYSKKALYGRYDWETGEPIDRL